MTSDPEPLDLGEVGAGPAEASESSGADPCGCVPRPGASACAPGDPHEVDAEPHDTHDGQPVGVQTPARELKLVVLLRPTASGFQARIAAGSEGCDPELRVADVPDLPAALAAVAELVAAAEARWRVQRRYPAAPRPAPAARQRPTPMTPPRSNPTSRPSDTTGDSATGPSTPTSAGAGQLSLFG